MITFKVYLKNLRDTMEEKEISQTDLSKKTGISNANISLALRGKNCSIKRIVEIEETIKKLGGIKCRFY